MTYNDSDYLYDDVYYSVILQEPQDASYVEYLYKHVKFNCLFFKAVIQKVMPS
jgi:hypothetical protein